MAALDLIKRSELAGPLTQSDFDGNLSALEAAVNLKVDLTDTRLTNARTPTAHQHPLTDLPEVVTALAAKAASSTVTGIQDTLDNLQDAIDAIPDVPGLRWSIGKPADSLGIDGDFCLDVTPGTLVLYGPKGVSPATAGHWPDTGITLLVPGDGTTVYYTEAEIVTRANAGTLSSQVSYRIQGTDETATVLVDTVVPNVVQISSPTKPPRLLVNQIEGRVLSSSNPTWAIIFDSPLA